MTSLAEDERTPKEREDGHGSVPVSVWNSVAGSSPHVARSKDGDDKNVTRNRGIHTEYGTYVCEHVSIQRTSRRSPMSFVHVRGGPARIACTSGGTRARPRAMTLRISGPGRPVGVRGGVNSRYTLVINSPRSIPRRRVN